MQESPAYGDVVLEVREFLEQRLAACEALGIDRGRLTVDPGIGFGKRLEHNLELIRRLGELRELGRPLLVGVSRKSFLARIEERAGAPAPAAAERTAGTAAAVTACVLAGADVLRVHDVGFMAQVVRVAWTLARRDAARD
jgi:dihydropteroate synthase